MRLDLSLEEETSNMETVRLEEQLVCFFFYSVTLVEVIILLLNLQDHPSCATISEKHLSCFHTGHFSSVKSFPL